MTGEEPQAHLALQGGPRPLRNPTVIFFKIRINEYLRSNLAMMSIPTSTSGLPPLLYCCGCLAVCLSRVRGVGRALHPSKSTCLVGFELSSFSQP